MSKSKELLKMFVVEGLVDAQMIPQDLPKLDNTIQQNKGQSSATTNKLEIPQPNEVNPTNPKKPDLPKELKDKDGDVEESSEYKMALEASHQCLSLAEYHLGKLNKMKELEEIEDVNLDKIGAAHKIITDTRQALQEMIKKCGENKSEPKEEKPVQEAIETKEPDSEEIIKNPKKYITNSLIKDDFVQAAQKRIYLLNEKMLKDGKRVLLLLRDTMAATIRSENKEGLPLIYFINGICYQESETKNGVRILTPFLRQETARSIANDLNNPRRYEEGKRRIDLLK